MKNLSKIGLIILFLLCTFLLAVRADAAEIDTESSVETYSISKGKEGYEAYKSSLSDTEPSVKAESLAEILNMIFSESEEANINFRNIVASEDIVFNGGSYNLKGKIDFQENFSLIIENGDIYLSEMNMTLSEGGIVLKDGSLTIKKSDIYSKHQAIRMDYFSTSKLTLISGNISSDSREGSIYLGCGTAKIYGGSVKNTSGAAIRNSGTLIMTGAPVISGVDADIFTSRPIVLSDSVGGFSGKCTVKYDCEFRQGKISILAYGASKENEENIKLIDRLGKDTKVKYYDSFSGISEKKFLTAYFPYEIKFAGIEEKSQYYLEGELISLPEVSERSGYEFLGWKIGGYDGEAFEPSTSANKNLTLYPSYRLAAPTFSLLSMDFVYDEEGKYLTLTEVEHPLLSEGVLSYKWYKDDEELSVYSDRILIKNVSDSGKYKCLFTFSYKSDSVSILTPPVTVTVHKKIIAVPKIPSVEYNGQMQYPEIYSLSVYEAESVGGTDAGVYPVKITLRDPDNFGFGEKGEESVTVDFVINKATNAWIEEPSIRSFYHWETLSAVATSKYGEVQFLFSKTADGEYTATLPSGIGTYYMKAEVPENENYFSVSSLPIEFEIMEDEILSLYIVSEAEEKRYRAFETFSPKGLSVCAVYTSGKEELIDISDIVVSYHSGDFLVYGDKSVCISYGGQTLFYPIEVSKAEYDISGIVFADCEYEYSAEFISPAFVGELPTGKDGIPLTATVVGGGTGVGCYSIELRFNSESQNYNIPGSINAVMKITQRRVDIVWENTDFVYDGALKFPTAYYSDVSGARVELYVEGARSYAGSYEASVEILDKNYTANNPTKTFVIAKAEYDLSGISWSEGEFTYDGTERRVTLSGLPEGVSVVGYSDNRATDAGTYFAAVTLRYDEKNYNAPIVSEYEWKISPIEYDLSGIEFSGGEFVYDGKPHFPKASGTLPVGIDGSSPSFEYSTAVTNVEEGAVCVVISFTSGSKNYLSPQSLECYIEILPKGIDVVWGRADFVYDGSALAPVAIAEECEITIIGAEIKAGKYTATAKTLNSNYYVINATCDFEIKKAENYWSVPPKASDIYSSSLPKVEGSAAFGETRYVYSTDKSEEQAAPDGVGIFYFKAVSDGDENHFAIESDWIEFEIIRVVAVGFEVELLRSEFLALDKLCNDDVSAYVFYNDSSKVKIPFSDITVTYTDGDCLKISHKEITLSYLTFSETKSISVSKRDYDLSKVSWEGISCVYDGKPKSAFLAGLPEGITVTEYSGNGGINAGEYKISAAIAFDEENYNPPQIITDTVMVIEKQTVVIRDIESVEYTSETIVPLIPTSELYTYEFSGAVKPGSYTVSFRLVDSDNYAFEGNLDSLEKSFEITKRKLTVKISDVEFYLLGKQSEPGFEIISGSLIEGEDIVAFYEIGEENVFATFEGENYDIEVIPGKAIRDSGLAPEDIRSLILLLCIILIGTTAVIIILINRKRILSYYARSYLKNDKFIPSVPEELSKDEMPKPDDDYPRDDATAPKNDKGSDDADKNESNKKENDIPPNSKDLKITEDADGEVIEDEKKINDASDDLRGATVIDAGYADSAITDSLARDLIRKEKDIETDGSARKIINVDTLSRSFSSGDRVDINILKGKSLIPYDTGYIKVLARGIIDKPLTVYANDFSLSAVKMIALAGGKSVKVNTSRPSVKCNFNKKT